MGDLSGNDTGSAGPEPRVPAAGESAAPRPGRTRRRPRRVLWAVIITTIVVFAVMQLVPYRVDNPAARREPAWNTTRTRQLAVAACFDCHSNETETYWWEDVAPVSWWITNHVEEGRAALNFSECVRGAGENEAAETIREGSMPPDYYTWLGLHSDAKLSATEQRELADGLTASLQGWRCGRGGD